MDLLADPTRSGSLTAQRVEPRRRSKGATVVKWVTTTDHKVIGNLYFVTSFVFFLLGGLMALVMRAELAARAAGRRHPRAVQPVVHHARHGHVAAVRDAAVRGVRQRRHAAADRVTGRGLSAAERALLLVVPVRRRLWRGLPHPRGAASFGWFAYAPLSTGTYSPGLGGDLWVFGLALAGFGTILGAVNFITTIMCLRAPGMTMFRMPMFTWTVLITSVMVLIAFPVLAAALLALGADRRFGAHVFDAEGGGAMLWQHLFWFFGHPEVYIIALPFFGIISEVMPVFSRKPFFGYKTMVFATIAIAALSMTVWAHHMYATGQVLLPFFAVMSMLIAVPTGIKFFNWIGTMWGGKVVWTLRCSGPSASWSPSSSVASPGS